MAAGHCYLNVVPEPRESKRYKKWCSKNNQYARFRYCYDDVAVQIACWTSQPSGNHETKAFGWNQLEDFDIANGTYVKTALRNFLATQPPINNVTTGAVVMPVSGWQSQLKVPTCVSPKGEIKTFKDIPTGGLKFRNPRFPCMCGDWGTAYEDTLNFFNAVKVGLGTKDGMDTRTRELHEFTCPARLEQLSSKRKLTPVHNFILYCALGIQMPPMDDENAWKDAGKWQYVEICPSFFAENLMFLVGLYTNFPKAKSRLNEVHVQNAIRSERRSRA